jgi:hypothetical protein
MVERADAMCMNGLSSYCPSIGRVLGRGNVKKPTGGKHEVMKIRKDHEERGGK